MSSKQQQAALLAVAMQLVGCVCAVMLALCAALGVTLMREGHYAASLQKGEYFDYVQIFGQLFLHVKQYSPGLFLVYIYNVSAPPSALPVRILHQNHNFPPIFLAQKETYAYICSAKEQW